MSNELIVIESIVPEKAFVQNGLDSVLEDIEKQLSPLVFDVSTEKGRKEISSVCYKIKRTKTAIDGLGKDYVSELKKLPKVVDGERKRAREFLEDLESSIRQPLTDWEKAEEDRKNTILARINDIDPFQGGIITISIGDYTLDQLNEMKSKTEQFAIDDSLDEYKQSAATRKDDILLKLSGIIANQEKYEAEQAELERLRKEAAEQAQRDREERIAKEAAEKARKEAEMKAEAERKEATKKEQEEKYRVEYCLSIISHIKACAMGFIDNQPYPLPMLIRELEEKVVIDDRFKEYKEQAENEKQIALTKLYDALEKQKEKEKEDQEEQQRLAKEEAERKIAEKKAANKKHMAKINNEAVDAIVLAMSEIDTGNQENAKNVAKAIVTAIARGEIPNITINY